ncbi:MATE family efflux transporter [Hespellia stercorisuis]|uniref:Multidrug export protein MepA n=1 Tax=Hespellia stercorisuis DSM 15480 TaxID=1121950 RepID=A0A1M6KCS1_9FIRM|nr:MATE family efflux transporter [Hespellia stercorisuis]SHJ56763.1 putative efflux protein, MATE family [Hespellia stercorisuis DSM 15480]
MSIRKQFAKYVSQNIMGMIGMSLYILADTFFISLAEGAMGITALNLVLPIYSLIFAVGAMIGVGSAIRFKILRARDDAHADRYFSNAVLCALALGMVFVVLGGLFPGQIVALMGGDAQIVAVGTSYTRIFMLFTPFFMWNHICNAFVRNDGNPTVAMAATLGSSLFNIVMDYVLMFPLGMGMAGAALATAVSPIIGIAICSIHFLSKKNTIRFRWTVPSPKLLLQSCQLGISAFIGEISSGVTTIVFNMLILRLAGNIGVAAYGVIANTSLVAISVFNGVAQGAQPLFSDLYGKGERGAVRRVLRMGVLTALVLAVIMVVLSRVGAESIVAVFNSERDEVMASYAVNGLKLYFMGFLFAGFNIVVTGYLSAVESVRWAFTTSIMRGVVAIILCALVLSATLGLNGVWLAFPAAEMVTAVVAVLAVRKSR